MTTTDDLRDRLATRAAATPSDLLAARARLDARLDRGARPARPGGRLVVAAVTAVVVGVLAATVVAVVHHRPAATGPAAATGPLPLTDWLFTVRTRPLPPDLDVVQYGHADHDRQVAVVLRPGDAATSNHVSALVELVRDPAVIGVVDPAPGSVPDGDGWSGPMTGDEYGVTGSQVVWTDASGYTLRAVAADLATARTLRDATEVGVTHPVRFPMAVATGGLPAGSAVQSVEYTGTQGIDAVVDVPGSPAWTVSVAAPGVYRGDVDGATTSLLTAGFSVVTGSGLEPSSGVLTSSVADVRVIVGAPGDASRPAVRPGQLEALVTGARFATVTLHPDQDSWFPLADALPLG